MIRSKIKKINRKSLISVLIPIGMFAFGFALIPLYDVFCDITGLNTKIEKTPYNSPSPSKPVDTSRLITVQFSTKNNNKMPWEFSPNLSEIKLHPGEIGILEFKVRNKTNQTMIGQIIPNIAPAEATNYLHKVECFCFTSQTLKPLEKKLMPLRIIVDRELPSHIDTLTLLYTLFDVTNLKPQS